MTDVSRGEPLLASGENYEIRVEERCAIIRVWSRPDLSFDRGAALAEEMGSHLIALARGESADVAGIVFDLRAAPPLVGKRTRAMFASAAGACEAAEVRFALLGSSGAHCQVLRLALGRSLPYTQVFLDEVAARGWAVGG